MFPPSAFIQAPRELGAKTFDPEMFLPPSLFRRPIRVVFQDCCVYIGHPMTSEVGE